MMKTLAFSNVIFIRPCRHFAKTLSSSRIQRWRNASSMSSSPGRGAWDLDRSFDLKPTPRRSTSDSRRRQSNSGGQERRSDSSARNSSRATTSSTGYNNNNHSRQWERGPPRRQQQNTRYSRHEYRDDENFNDDGDEYDNYYDNDENYNDDYSDNKRGRDSFPRQNGYRRQNNYFQDRDNRDRESQYRPRSRSQNNRYNDNKTREEPLSPERQLIRQALDASEETDDLIYGISPVLLALRSDFRDKFIHLFIQQRSGKDNSNDIGKSTNVSGPSRKASNAEAMETILSLATRYEIPMTTLSKGDLNLLSENRPHQGLVLQASKRQFEDLKHLAFVDKNEHGRIPCFLVLDEITDPQNAGALIRSAHFLGADGVIMCKRNSCGLSAVVSKASAGALEIMNVYGITSMPRFLRTCRDDGWHVIGMACGSDAVSSKQIALDKPTLVVLGSEGKGLRTMVRQSCDQLVEIEGWGNHEDVDSLNVSVAGAVALYQLLAR